MESDSEGQTDESSKLNSPSPCLVPEEGAPRVRNEGDRDTVSFELPHPEVLLCPFGCRLAGYKGKDRFASLSRKHLQKEHGLYGYEFVCRFCHRTGSELRKTSKVPGGYEQKIVKDHLAKAHPREMKILEEKARGNKFLCELGECKKAVNFFQSQGKLDEHIRKAHTKQSIKEMVKTKFPFREKREKDEFQGNMFGEHSPPTRKGAFIDSDSSPELCPIKEVKIKIEPVSPPVQKQNTVPPDSPARNTRSAKNRALRSSGGVPEQQGHARKRLNFSPEKSPKTVAGETRTSTGTKNCPIKQVKIKIEPTSPPAQEQKPVPPDSPARNTRSAKKKALQLSSRAIPVQESSTAKRRLTFSSEKSPKRVAGENRNPPGDETNPTEFICPATDEVVIRMDEELGQKIYSCLARDAWLNDEVIHTYLVHSVLPLRPKTLVVDSQIFTKVRGNQPIQFVEGRKKFCSPEYRVDWDTVVIAVHEGNHWTLAIGTRLVLKYFDTNRGRLSESRRRELRVILQALGAPGCLIKAVPFVEFFQQSDATSCGPGVCMLAERVLKGQSLKFDKQDVMKWRRETFKLFETLFRDRQESSCSFIEVLPQAGNAREIPKVQSSSAPEENIISSNSSAGKGWTDDDVLVGNRGQKTSSYDQTDKTAAVKTADGREKENTGEDGGDSYHAKASTDCLQSPSKPRERERSDEPITKLGDRLNSASAVEEEKGRLGKESVGNAYSAAAAAAGEVQKETPTRAPTRPAFKNTPQRIPPKTSDGGAASGGEPAAATKERGNGKPPNGGGKENGSKEKGNPAGSSARRPKGSALVRATAKTQQKSLHKLVANEMKKENLGERVKKHALDRITGAKEWDEFEVACLEFTAMIKALKQGRDPFKVDAKALMAKLKNTQGKKHQERPGSGSVGSENTPLSTSEAQRMYRMNKKAVMRTILETKSVACEIPLAELEKYYKSLFSEKGKSDSAALEGWVSKPDSLTEAFCEPFRIGELNLQFNKAKDTAPGMDGIRYSDLNRLDSDRQILLAIFKRCAKERKVPEHWKKAKTILLYKKSDPKNPENWRPIALSNTIYKLYTGLWANRLSKLEDLISPEQKGFCRTDGTGEHSAVLRNVIHQVVNNQEQMVVAWLDLTNAFGSVPHKVITSAIKGFGFPERFQKIVRDLYTNSSTTVNTSKGITAEIPIKAGVKQGDPISPILFNICMEPVLRKFKERFPDALTVHGLPISILAFADDLVIVAKNKEEMQRMLNAMVELMSDAGLAFNPSKCATLHVNKGKVYETKFLIQGRGVRNLDEDGTYEYLGVQLGKNKRSDMHDFAVTFLNDLKAIEDSKLAPWQRLDAIKTFVITKVVYELKHGDPYLKDLKPLDTAMLRVAKRICYLPENASRDYFFGQMDSGCLGFLSLEDEAHLQSVNAVSRLLYAEDKGIRQFFENIWLRTTDKWIKRGPTVPELVQFLNGETGGDFDPVKGGCSGQSHGLMTRIRRSMRHFTKVNGFETFKFDFVCDALVLKVQKCGDESETILNVQDKKTFYTKLRIEVSKNYVSRLALEKKSMGKVIAATKTQPLSSKFLRTGLGLTFSAWRFIHRARLNLHNLNGSTRRGKRNKACRVCGYAAGAGETLPHVLCHCAPQLKAGITKRHDAVLDRIVDALPTKNGVELRIDLKGRVSKKRPDIVLIDRKTKRVCIADVCCPFDNGADAISAATKRKIEHYKDEAAAYRKDGFEVHVGAITIGALGTWCPQNILTLEKLGMSKKIASKLAPFLIGEAIECSKDIFWTHILQDRYTPAYNMYNRDSVWAPKGASSQSQ